MNKLEKTLSRLLTIFTFMAIGNLIGSFIGGHELPKAVMLGYSIFIPLGLIFMFMDWKSEKQINNKL